eukprot:366175-Chlamydomonas_euryale.AAC.10
MCFKHDRLALHRSDRPRSMCFKHDRLALHRSDRPRSMCLREPRLRADWRHGKATSSAGWNGPRKVGLPPPRVLRCSGCGAHAQTQCRLVRGAGGRGVAKKSGWCTGCGSSVGGARTCASALNQGLACPFNCTCRPWAL